MQIIIKGINYTKTRVLIKQITAKIDKNKDWTWKSLKKKSIFRWEMLKINRIDKISRNIALEAPLIDTKMWRIGKNNIKIYIGNRVFRKNLKVVEN
jgi:hypothetical protein